MENHSAGLVVMNAIAPDPVSLIGNYELTGDGTSRYRQVAVTARVHAGKDRDLFVSYVNSRARGDMNDFGSYLGTFPLPIIRPNTNGVLSTDLPNRLLAWGTVKLPDGFLISPVMEFRSGFPYSTLRCRAELYGSSQRHAVSEILLARFAGIERHQGQSEIYRAAFLERLQPHQPFQSGSGTRQYRGPGVRTVFWAARAQIYGGFRRSVLKGMRSERGAVANFIGGAHHDLIACLQGSCDFD